MLSVRLRLLIKDFFSIGGCLSECDHDTEAYEILESLLETEGDCSSWDGIDLDESSEESASDDSDADPDFTPSTPPRTRGTPFYNMYSRKKRKMALSRKPNSGIIVFKIIIHV